MCLSVAVQRPDDLLVKGEHEGFEWNVMNNGAATRCGYVRVPKGHPWHGKDNGDIDPDVHGGLTFAELDKPCDKPGEDDAWWLGFDCGHGMDEADPALPGYCPSDLAFSLGYGTVRTQEYVEENCRSLCEQAAAANR